MKTFFISDIHFHLHESEHETYKRRLFLDFLKLVQKEKASLYIVGDMFDFWFEYKDVIPRQYFDILVALKETTDAGCDVYIISGNHDYWVDGFFEKEVGAQVSKKPIETEIDGNRFFIVHGDGVTKGDIGYKLIKPILRNPLNIRLFKMLHPATAFGIARWVSRKSRELTLRDPKRDEADRQHIIAYGRENFAKGFDCVVMGHYHLPTEHHEDGHTFINLGDWMRYFTYGLYEKGQLNIHYWPGDHPQL